MILFCLIIASNICVNSPQVVVYQKLCYSIYQNKLMASTMYEDYLAIQSHLILQKTYLYDGQKSPDMGENNAKYLQNIMKDKYNIDYYPEVKKFYQTDVCGDDQFVLFLEQKTNLTNISAGNCTALYDKDIFLSFSFFVQMLK